MSFLDSHSTSLVDLDDPRTSTDTVPPLMSEPSPSFRESVELGSEHPTPRSKFAERIAEVSVLFQTVVDEMKTASCAIVDTGRPPDYHLVQLIGDCHRLFLRLRHDVRRYAESIGATAPPADQITSLSELFHWLDSPDPKTSPEITPPVETPPAEASVEPEPVTEPEPVASAIILAYEPSPAVAETTDELSAVESDPVPAPATEYDAPGEDVRHAALNWLDKVLRLSVRNGSEFLPLQECLKSAEALRELVLASSPSALPLEAELLARGDHPFVGLLNMVEGVGTLTDAQWAEVHSQVSSAFGRELAVAASRGRLLIRPDLA